MGFGGVKPFGDGAQRRLDAALAQRLQWEWSGTSKQVCRADRAARRTRYLLEARRVEEQE